MLRFSYSRSRRLGAATILILLSTLVLTVPALAGVTWCRADPIVRLNGTEVQIWVSLPETYAARVNGPIDVRIATPRAVDREVVMLDSGFNGYGETVSFSNKPGQVRNGSFAVRIQVRVPIDMVGLPLGTTVPLRIEVITANGEALYFNGMTTRTVFTIMVQGAP